MTIYDAAAENLFAPDWLKGGEQKSFDQLATLAAMAINAPMAMVAICDQQRVFFKSKFGPLELTEMALENFPFENLLCSPEPTTITNIENWPGYPEKFQAPVFDKAKSILWAPILWQGIDRPVGAVFTLDYQPRTYEQNQLNAISSVARAAANELRLQNSVLSLTANEEFLAFAAHELKTPITSVSMVLQLLLRTAHRQSSIPSETVLRSIDAAKRQTESLDRLVDKLLDLSRLSRGKLPLEFELTDLSSLVSEVVAKMQAQADWADCLLSFEAPGPVICELDPTRIEQVVSNLITNAIKYGAGKPIQVTVVRESGNAKIYVQDEGMGISKEDQEKIFLRFERASRTHRRESLGLGLYISSAIAKAHKGRILVDSELGHGSTFAVEIPIIAGTKQEAERELRLA